MGAADPDFCNWQLEHIYRGLRKAGRKREDILIDLIVTMSIDEDAEQAVNDVRAWATSQAATFAVWKAMPPGWERFRPEFKAAEDAYHYEEHLSLRAEHKEIVSEEFVRSVTISGNRDHCLSRLLELSTVDIDRISFALLSRGRMRRLEELGKHVIPRLKSGLDGGRRCRRGDEHDGERRVALVTAAAGAGIGAAIARQLASDGYDVVITDAHERRCAAFAGQLADEHGREFLSMPLDVTDFDAVGAVTDAVVGRRGRIDALVNNAGWSKIELVAEMTPETWRRCLDVDLNGTFYAMRHVLPHMIARGAGAIVNISSIAAWETTTEHGAAYSAAKAGILALTRVAAAENGRHGIRVNAVAPGLIYNDFLRRIYPDTFFDGYAESRSLVGRVGQPGDIADLVSFLISDRAGYITGEVYGVSGGVSPNA